MEEPILRGTQAEVLHALERRYQQLKKGATYMFESQAQPEPNQEDIDTEAAELLRKTFCFKHGEPMKQDPYDGVWYCPDCEADAVIYRVHPTSPHEGKF